MTKASLITGSRESWFFTADILVDRVSALKFDDKSNSLVLAKVPTKFHIGLNYSPFGDLATREETFKDLLFVKLMVAASSTPLESFGVGLGIRGRKVFHDSLDLTPLSVFGAYVWTNEDGQAANGSKLPAQIRKGAWRVGVSFNLSKAPAWVK